MEKFTTLTAIAAPLDMINVDTDMIIPKQFLTTIQRSGLGVNAFYEMRYDDNGKPNPDFVLNNEPYDKAEILIAGANFGCGSSREHAPWAILDFGIKCVIAPSYADIFYNNCFKNGILPVKLSEEQVRELMDRAQEFPGEGVTVDLPSQKVRAGNHIYEFELDPFYKHCLVNGLDDIGLTMEKAREIQSFEQSDAAKRPWLY